MFIVNIASATKSDISNYPRSAEDIKAFPTLNEAKRFVNGYLSTFFKDESQGFNVHRFNGGDDGVFNLSYDFLNCNKKNRTYVDVSICIRKLNDDGTFEFLV